MLRRILIPLDPSPFAQAALDWGCYAAKITSAELTGLAVLDQPGIERSIGSIPAGGIHYAQHLIEKKEKDALEYIEKLLKNFEDKCKQEGVAYRLAERQGNPSDQIIRDSIFYDLVVIGLRTYYQFDDDAKQGESVVEVLNQSVTPVLAVPDRFVSPERRKIKALVAFDGSLPSVRSIHRFAQLVRTAEFSVTILMSHPDMDYAKGCLSQAEAFMRAHDFKDIKTVWTPQNIIEEIREEYLEQTNLLVLGAHSKRGITNFMVGSLSKSLIKMENKYILIGQ
ncbi:MAG: universal stress protein [Candidatus Hatepunaea meridiana]|nr:universal stress protein [Candidatus Hatepunaea meridiana]